MGSDTPPEDLTTMGEVTLGDSTVSLQDDLTLDSGISGNISKRKKRSKPRRNKSKRQSTLDPGGFHGSEIDMDSIRSGRSRLSAQSSNTSETPKEHEKKSILRKARKTEIGNEDKEAHPETYRPQIRKGEPTSSIRFEDDVVFHHFPEEEIIFEADGLPLPHDESQESINFLEDPEEEMTIGRRIALRLMQKKWYNPLATAEDPNDRSMKMASMKTARIAKTTSFRDVQFQKPSLEKAWAYFERVTLYRYILDDESESPPKNYCEKVYRMFWSKERTLKRAEPGLKSRKTILYDPFDTPHSQMGEFGLGVGLYFTTLRAVCLITFLAGLINLKCMWYFASDEYMPPETREKLTYFLQGSAICTDTDYVPCPECQCGNETLWESNRCATSVEGNETLTFTLRNQCNAAVWEIAAVNYTSLVCIYLAVIFMSFYLRWEEVKYDENAQTAQDYSIEIANPPIDAHDPEEWREYFREQFDGAEVAVCTCELDNDLLIQTLVKRREAYRGIQSLTDPGMSMDVINIGHIAAEEERNRNIFSKFLALLLPGVPELLATLVVLNAKIQALSQLTYHTTKVFVSFETERDQRHVLNTLSVGSVRVKRNDHTALSDPKYLFRSKHMLNVAEADEPNTIHWESLNVQSKRKFREQCFTNMITFAGVAGCAVIVKLMNDYSAIAAALTISVFNAGFPEVARVIVKLESHATEGSKQASMFFKIAVFRWVNTAIVITLITPFTSTLAVDNGLIPQVYTIFFSEIITLNAYQLIDPGGHFKRHILAPRAKNQDAMNMCFVGEEVELAERYTNMTKIFFLAVWYSAVYPAGLFMASLALFVNYYTDRFSFMRSWKRAPQIGTEVSKISRKYFFSLANVAMAVISSLYWSGYPYDNLCDTGEDVKSSYPNYSGNFTGTIRYSDDAFGTKKNDTLVDITVSPEDPVYKFCLQDLMKKKEYSVSFPFIPAQQDNREGEWMTPEQEQVSTVFGWTAVVVICLVFIRLALSAYKAIEGSFVGDYKAVGDDQNIAWSEVPHISAYIPQVTSPFFSYPLIVVETDEVDPTLYDWEDPENDYEYYDLTKDTDGLLENTTYSRSDCFGKVKCWKRKAE